MKLDVQLVGGIHRQQPADPQVFLLVPGNHPEPPDQVHQHHLDLLNREPLAHAVPGTGRKRNVREVGPLPLHPALSSVPFGDERIGTFPNIRVPLHVVNEKGQARAFGYYPAVDDAVLVQFSTNPRSGRVHAQHLPDDQVKVLERGDLVLGHVAVQLASKVFIDLSEQLLLRFGVPSEQVDRPREGQGRGVVTGEHESVHFFLDLLGRQLAAVFVHGPHHHVQEGLSPSGAAFWLAARQFRVDDVTGELVQLSDDVTLLPAQ